MEISDLYASSQKLIDAVSVDKERYLAKDINWDLPMICIKGARGVGKTTLMLQELKKREAGHECLYVSLDNLWFSEHRLVDLAEYHYSHGGKYLYVDEVHRYPYTNWIQEMKNIYDSLPGLHIVFSGSSMLKIDMSIADLSRRCLFYTMAGMSFREYLDFCRIGTFPKVSLTDILTNHSEIETTVNSSIRPLEHFTGYLKKGYYPFSKIYGETYPEALRQVVNVIIENDMAASLQVEKVTINKFKRLLYIISSSVPFSPNISRLAENLSTNRNQTYSMLDILEKAALIINLHSGKDNFNQFQKPDKIYLDNTNLIYALSSDANIGTVRETFFANQLRHGHKIFSTEKGDFLVDGKYLFEVGGKNKSFNQIKDLPDSFLAVDEIEYGHEARIPLWLFGFLY